MISSTEKFVKKANIIHDYKYDYSLVEYSGVKNKVIIICPIHKNFMQTPTNHLSGFGCLQCGIENRAKKKVIDAKNVFIEKANLIHNYKYDYFTAEYEYATEKIKIICRTHGVFEQTPNNHLNGKGCRSCVFDNLLILQPLNENDVLERFKKIHHNKYDYSLVKYNGMDCKIQIICPKHGIFNQLPSNHISGKGCNKCGFNSSKPEQIWLDQMLIQKENRNYSIKIDGKLFKVDGINLSTNTIYEFYGDYWHGNPQRFNSNDINLSNKKVLGIYTSKL